MEETWRFNTQKERNVVSLEREESCHREKENVDCQESCSRVVDSIHGGNKCVTTVSRAALFTSVTIKQTTLFTSVTIKHTTLFTSITIKQQHCSQL